MTLEIKKDQVNEKVIDRHNLDVRDLKKELLKESINKNTKEALFEVEKDTITKKLNEFKSLDFKKYEKDNKWTLTIQIALKILWEYSADKVDGIYGKKTKDAVKSFQTKWNTSHDENNQIESDGIAGKTTMEKLVDAIGIIQVEKQPVEDIIVKKNEAYLQKNFGSSMSVLYHNDTKTYAIYESNATLPFLPDSALLDLNKKTISFLGNTLDLSKEGVSDDELFRIAALVRHLTIMNKDTSGKFAATWKAGATDTIVFERFGFLKKDALNRETIYKHIPSMGYATKLDKFVAFLNSCKEKAK